MVKLYFELDPDHWSELASESAWVTPLEGGRYRLENAPWFAREVACGDIVTARPDEDGDLWFRKVVERSGRSVFRVIVRAEGVGLAALPRWRELEAMGCAFEELAEMSLWAIDVPKEADLDAVTDLLEAGEADGTWTYDEGWRADWDDEEPGSGFGVRGSGLG